MASRRALHSTDQPIARDPWRAVHDAIRAAILAGEYPPGSRLVEQELADRFGTSRGPVRTALLELERSGLVVSVDRRGSYVRSLSDADVAEIFTLWQELFLFAARRAIGRVTPENRQWIDDFLAHTATVEEPTVLLEHSIELARHVFRMAQHRRALDIFESLIDQARTRSMFMFAQGEDEYWHGRTDFEPFCRALLAGDVEAVLRTSEVWVRRSRSFWPATRDDIDADS